MILKHMAWAKMLNVRCHDFEIHMMGPRFQSRRTFLKVGTRAKPQEVSGVTPHDIASKKMLLYSLCTFEFMCQMHFACGFLTWFASSLLWVTLWSNLCVKCTPHVVSWHDLLCLCYGSQFETFYENTAISRVWIRSVTHLGCTKSLLDEPIVCGGCRLMKPLGHNGKHGSKWMSDEFMTISLWRAAKDPMTTPCPSLSR